MSRSKRLLLITFLLTVIEIFADRGIFFFTSNVLRFSDGQNLALALAKSAMGLLAAFASHRVALRLGHRRTLLLTFGLTMLADLLLLFFPVAPLVVSVALLRSCMGLLRWPIIESYVSAGLTPRQTSDALGRFNIAWALAPAIGLTFVGPVLQAWPPGIFLISLLLSGSIWLLIRPLEPDPEHLASDHPDALAAGHADHYRNLMITGRWLMLLQSVLFLVLISLLPGMFRRAGIEVGLAPAMSSFMDFARLGMFALMGHYAGWHGRRLPLFVVAMALPTGAALVLLSPSPYLWFVGQILFGAAAGASYFSALYYAMVVKQASVEGGGTHEGLGALGGMAGPGFALAGNYLATSSLASGAVTPTQGAALALAPFAMMLFIGAVVPLTRRNADPAEAPPIAPAPDAP
ncbi:MAG: MFS transporter [Planctomycetota bacterium]|nr:MFS transporter [Planctomycetota bacterium]